MTKQLHSRALVALSKATNARSAEYKAARAALAPGDYEQEILARIRYRITVGKDYDQIASAKIPWQGIALVLMDKLSGPILDAAVKQALKVDSKDSTWATVKQRARKALDTISAPARQSFLGKVTGECSIAVSDYDPTWTINGMDYELDAMFDEEV